MDLEFIHGQMEGDMKDNGNKEISMVKESSYLMMIAQKVIGTKERFKK